MSNKKNFLGLVSVDDTKIIDDVKERIKNRAMLQESQQIAIKVLMKLNELGWSQINLAKKLGVSPQQVSKIVSGQENLTIATQVKLQNILEIPVLASYYENHMNKMEELILTIAKRVDKIVIQNSQINTNYEFSKLMKMERSIISPESYSIAI